MVKGGGAEGGGREGKRPRGKAHARGGGKTLGMEGHGGRVWVPAGAGSRERTLQPTLVVIVMRVNVMVMGANPMRARLHTPGGSGGVLRRAVDGSRAYLAVGRGMPEGG